MTYADYRIKNEKEYSALPIFFAFSEKQLEEEMNKRGLTLNDTDKIYRLNNLGGFYLKSDADVIRAFFKRDKYSELRNLMENEDGFAYEAFEYEMYNHEYPINWEGDYDVCSIFGDCEYGDGKDWVDYLREGGYSNKVMKEFNRAAKAVRANDCW